MSLDSREVSEKVPEESLGSLGGCLVDGDAEQRHRERRVRRRSLALSILIQSAVLTLLVLLPLFGKTERITLATATPIPPYSPYKGPVHEPGPQHARQQQTICLCAPTNISPIIVTHDPRPSEDGTNHSPFEGLGPGIPGASRDMIPIPDSRTQVPPPPDDPSIRQC